MEPFTARTLVDRRRAPRADARDPARRLHVGARGVRRGHLVRSGAGRGRERRGRGGAAPARAVVPVPGRGDEGRLPSWSSGRRPGSRRACARRLSLARPTQTGATGPASAWCTGRPGAGRGRSAAKGSTRSRRSCLARCRTRVVQWQTGCTRPGASAPPWRPRPRASADIHREGQDDRKDRTHARPEDDRPDNTGSGREGNPQKTRQDEQRRRDQLTRRVPMRSAPSGMTLVPSGSPRGTGRSGCPRQVPTIPDRRTPRRAT